ncbi:hypothetical protein BO86DRAFT_242394 [Aspergillus japonicus CBS 114.51]|uniref:Uncharacterized protein n=1 Tax=Aspergillus japonicus CBS 114.51 TaxID=1448312 RepID=A0A8T8X8Q3_ASPJA|nr:hypothetical protein BO86DRAFT_242394 [Aspergillus japonicus CBS 114.51]RAH84390.1 hypothetical protein BO86DRAFT_242394 [Aspergillus japonicus CBS 114.51]
MQRTPARLFEITGKISVEDVAARSGAGWKNGINAAVPHLRAKYPRAATASFNGSQAHKSSKDPTDPKNCVTLAMFSERGTRIASAHIHEDGTFNDFPSRAGRAGIQEVAKSDSASFIEDASSRR